MNRHHAQRVRSWFMGCGDEKRWGLSEGGGKSDITLGIKAMTRRNLS